MTVLQATKTNVFFGGRRRFKSYALATAGAAALCVMAQAASAQTQVAAAAAGDIEQVTVTGTRVMRDGYSQPTPVTVLGTEDINNVAPANLADFVNQIPSVQGSSTPDTNGTAVSSGTAGVNALNLRNIGTNRTLVLLDGHRQSASTSSGTVDVNTIPQQLVQRVDIVTGGASANYGSDAVGGVVNFILDKSYSGLKGGVTYGQTTNDLAPNYQAELTYGADLFDGKGHILISGEYFTKEAINDYVPKWMSGTGYFTIQNPAYTATNGRPFYLVGPGNAPSQVAPGGLVVSGPLMGTFFGVNAVPSQLSYGAISGPWMLGGDTSTTYQGYIGTESYAAGEDRANLYSRVSYDLTPDIHAYIEGSVSRYKGNSNYSQPAQVGGITIQSTNAFLPQSTKTAMATAKVTSLTLGSSNIGFPVVNDRFAREVHHFAAGADGDFNFLGTDWKWDIQGQFGGTTTREQLGQVWNTAKLNLATNAVVAPANTVGIPVGSIVCASTLVTPNDGCMPLSRIGPNGGTQTAAAYQAGINYAFDRPYRLQRIAEPDFSFNVSGDPFSNWQGPVSVAFGAEWRMESINGDVPPQFQSGWAYGNFLVNKGHYSVGEAYLETVVPLAPGLDMTAAGRYAAYSTAGGVSTWKGGLTYAPEFLPDVKLRATYSHDIRAPNLADLFAAGTSTSNAVLINNVSYPITYQTVGNPNLSPENANTLGVGVVLTPTFLEGFTAAIDFYDITLKKAISSIAVQNATDLCYKSGIQAFCNNITYVTGVTATPTNYGPQLRSLILQPFNFASQRTHGIDFEMTYKVPMDSFDGLLGQIPGDLTLHALATNYMENITNNGVTAPTNAAGANFAGVPSWVYRITANYSVDSWNFFIAGRGVSAGVYSNEYTECTTSCPAINPPFYTTNNNKLPGAFYVDTNVSYGFDFDDVSSEVFFSVKNLFGTSPPLVGNGPASISVPARPQTALGTYDYLGRVFRMGIRFNT